MKTIYSIIQELAATRSRNEKEAILRREVDNTDLKTFFRLSLSNQVNFYQKKEFSVNVRTEQDSYPDICYAFMWLENVIAGRNITGNEARDAIQKVLYKVSPDDEIVLRLVLQKKTGCDIGTASVNKIWSKLIPEMPCLLATNWTDKLAAKLNWKAGCYINQKLDGLRINVVIDEEGGVKCYTRAGNELNVHNRFDSLGTIVRGVVLDGELLTIGKDNKFNSRQVSNGVCSKAIHGTMTKEESETLHIVVWDTIPIADYRNGVCKYAYSTRFDNLLEFCEAFKEESSHLISPVLSKIVHSIEEAQEFYQEMLDTGEEGAVVKDPNMIWEDKRSKLQLKMKAELVCDLKVIGWIPGKCELKNNLGALSLESADGKVKVNVSGFSLKLRSEIFANLINGSVKYCMVEDGIENAYYAEAGYTDIAIGSIVEVTYNAKIKDKTSDTWSLFLPRFSKARFDKTVANTLEEIK